MRRIISPAFALAAILVASLGAQGSYIYAIQGARIVPVSGPPVENGTIVLRDGLIAAVGADVTVPAGAQVIAGKGLTVYPGLIDMGTAAGLEMPPVPRAENPQTTADVERVKAEYLLRAHLRAADHVNPTAQALQRAAAAGITAALATPGGDVLRGQSALISTALPPEPPQIGSLAPHRRGALVLKTPVALHVTFSARPQGGSAYPNSLMGVIAFVRQTFLDAQHWTAVQSRTGAAAAAAASDSAAPELSILQRLPYRAAAEALQPALAGQLPVAFEAAQAREILRALDMAREFKLSPIVTNAREADQVAADLKAAGARVVLSLNFPKRPEWLAPDADESLRTLRARAEAPRTAAKLHEAGVPFAFASDGLSDPRDFVRHAARTVQQGLARDEALRALTLHAARLAGAADRVGSLDPGKLANLVVTSGDLFDEKMTIAHVFVEGRPVNLEAAATQGSRRGQ